MKTAQTAIWSEPFSIRTHSAIQAAREFYARVFNADAMLSSAAFNVGRAVAIFMRM